LNASIRPTTEEVLEGKALLAIAMRRLSAFGGSNRDVDVVLDLMIHDIDLALDLTGQEPTSMTAFGLTAHNGAIDHAVVHLGFGSGPMVTLTASRVTEQKIRSIKVTALDAYVEADLLNKSISVHRRTTAEYLAHNQRGIKYRQESILEGIHVPSQEPLFSELQHFVDCVLTRAAGRLGRRRITPFGWRARSAAGASPDGRRSLAGCSG
jgi:predicted dehydrogenase